jgi:hypothetical protein
MIMKIPHAWRERERERMLYNIRFIDGGHFQGGNIQCIFLKSDMMK